MLYRTGLRVSEALSLRPNDLDLTRGTVSVLYGKGDRKRTIGIDPGAQALIECWLNKRTQLNISPRKHLFCTLKGDPVNTSYIRRLLPRLAHKAKIDKRVHPHGLRHTHAAELAQEGLPINLIQQQLGHKNLATTDLYLKHIHPTTLIDTIRVREW
jgi:site-specific recombinase XerD